MSRLWWVVALAVCGLANASQPATPFSMSSAHVIVATVVHPPLDSGPSQPGPYRVHRYIPD